MTSVGFWKLVWKECRLQRGHWLALLLVGVLAQLAVVALVRNYRGATGQFLFGWTLEVSELYVLVSTAFLFAGEHEGKTYDYQSWLPTRSLSLFLAKVAFVVLSTLALALTLMALMWLWTSGDLPGLDSMLGSFYVFGVRSFEVLAWSIFFSLLCKRTVPAIFAAARCMFAMDIALARTIFNVAPETIFGYGGIGRQRFRDPRLGPTRVRSRSTRYRCVARA